MKETDYAAIDYIANKYCPYLIIFVLLFINFELTELTPWGISICVFFIDKYAFKIGRSVGEYENNPNFKQEVDSNFDDE